MVGDKSALVDVRSVSVGEHDHVVSDDESRGLHRIDGAVDGVDERLDTAESLGLLVVTVAGDTGK